MSESQRSFAAITRKGQMVELLRLVLEWAQARNLPKGATAVSQGLKMTTEFNEVLAAMAREDLPEIIDGIGDSLVVAVIVAEQMGVSMQFIDAVGERATVIHTLPDTVSVLGEVRVVLDAGGHLGLACDAVLKNRPQVYLSEIVLFVDQLATLAEYNAVTLVACLRRAYTEIKDRKGVMYNGSFVKSDDPAYEAAVIALRAENA